MVISFPISASKSLTNFLSAHTIFPLPYSLKLYLSNAAMSSEVSLIFFSISIWKFKTVVMYSLNESSIRLYSLKTCIMSSGSIDSFISTRCYVFFLTRVYLSFFRSMIMFLQPLSLCPLESLGPIIAVKTSWRIPFEV